MSDEEKNNHPKAAPIMSKKDPDYLFSFRHDPHPGDVGYITNSTALFMPAITIGIIPLMLMLPYLNL